MQNKLAVQLYTLREECDRDFPEVLRTLKKMGWAGVQLAGYHGHDPSELAALIRELGLQTAGMHVGYDRLVDDFEQVALEAELFQTRDIICPGIPPEMRNEESYRQIRQVLNDRAKSAASRNLRVSYHNHAFEFETMVGELNALEYMVEPSEDNLVLAELDVYWVKKGGRDIESFIAPYANRMPIIHLKDMANDEQQSFAEIGTGSIDFEPILSWGERNGIEWYVVEQDVCKGNALDCVQTSYTNITKLIASM